MNKLSVSSAKRKNAIAIIVFLAPAFIVYTVFTVTAIIQSGYYSLFDWDGLTNPIFVGIENYITIFTSSKTAFRQAVLNSFVFAGVSLFIQLPFAIFISIVISRVTKGEKFFRTLYFIPVLIMTAITAQLWMKIYDPNYGLINQMLEIIGLESLQRNWTVDESTALLSVILPGLWQWMGYYMLILYTGVKSISPDINEAAAVDGASKFQQAIHITIPMILPAIKICVTFMVIGSMKAFDLVYLITRGGPMNMTEVPTLTMFITIFNNNQYGLGSAMTVVIVFFCLIYAIVINKIFKRTEE